MTFLGVEYTYLRDPKFFSIRLLNLSNAEPVVRFLGWVTATQASAQSHSWCVDKLHADTLHLQVRVLSKVFCRSWTVRVRDVRFRFVWSHDSWSQQGHSASCMNILFCILASQQSRLWVTPRELSAWWLQSGDYSRLLTLSFVCMYGLTYSLCHPWGFVLDSIF